MKIRINSLTIILSIIILAACSSASESENASNLAEFRSTVDSFCTSIAEADTKINSIDTGADEYNTELINELNTLKTSFSEFAAVDFPEEYDYLEHLADEAYDYMNRAVEGYTKVYTDDSLSSEQMQTEFDNATEYYNNAFKRIKVIMTFLNGETSEDATVSSEQSGTLTSTEDAGQ